MANKFLDDNGLLYFWTQLKTILAGKVNTESGKGLSTNDFTDADQTKLSGIQTGAEVNQNAFSTVKVGTTNVSADSATDTLTLIQGSNVTLTPDASGDAVTIAATDTTYSTMTGATAGVAGSSGLVPAPSAGDQAKFLTGAGTWANAESNQNAFSNVKVGQTTIAADSPTDTLEIVAGSNVTVTPDAINDTVTIAATDTTYSTGTSSTAGLTKLYGTTGSNTDGAMTQAAVQSALSGYKHTQTAVTDPTASGNSLTFIDSISQGTDGVITPTKKTVAAATASTAGITKLYTAIGANTDGAMSQAAIQTTLASYLTTSAAASTYATKSDITNVYKYKGSVATYADLPSTGNTPGDVYNVEATGMNYAWDDNAWDPLGEVFTINTISNSDIDTIMAS